MQKPYKHLTLVQFSSIKRVVDICETPDCRNVFALITKKIGEKERLYAFTIIDQTTDKEEVLTSISKAVCTNMCRTDYETLLAAVESHVLNLDASDLATGGNTTLSRAASKFGKKVGRVFSLNKTPNRMKRAISSVTAMISPLRRESSVYGMLPPALPPRSTPSRACAAAAASVNTNGNNDTFDEQDRYSEIVDQLSIGTPAMQRRRETLAGITYFDLRPDLHPDCRTPQKTCESEDRTFATPLPVARRPSPTRRTPINIHRAAIHSDFPSTQSLDYDPSSLLSRTPSMMSCVTKDSENED